jgi:hypothetical protein
VSNATIFCTIIARNFLPYARVLASSILSAQEARIYVVVIDDERRSLGDGEESFRILRPKEIGLSESEFSAMSQIYGLRELSTSVKPWLLQTLLRQSGAPVIYLDPDIEVFWSLEDLPAIAAAYDIVLTPHTLLPLKRDGLSPTEPYILQAGAFNLGFIAVGQGAEPFLEWWKERLRTDCIMDGSAGYFVDQKWIDLVPSYFNHHILRSPCFNVAYWNADQRPLAWTGERYEIEGEPLRFYHFSGFDPDQPESLCRYIKSPRVRLDDYPLLKGLTRDYTQRLMDAGYRQFIDVPYGLAGGAGSGRIGPFVRKVRRRLVRLKELSKQA